jgi:hypothetical protein
MTTSKGENRYYLQIGDTDCTLVINETDYDQPIETARFQWEASR